MIIKKRQKVLYLADFPFIEILQNEPVMVARVVWYDKENAFHD